MKKAIEMTYEGNRRIIKGLGYYRTNPVDDIRDLVKKAKEEHENKTAFMYKEDGKLITKSYVQFDTDVDSLGTALCHLKFEVPEEPRIAVIGENRYEWGLAYLSIINGTGIGIPLDKHLPKVEIVNLLQRSKAEGIFYTKTYDDMMHEIADEGNTSLKHFICMDDVNARADARFHNMSELVESGWDQLRQGDRIFTGAYIPREEMRILLFTSGTTKMSKGVMLSHSNIVNNIRSLDSIIQIYEDDVHLSLLPLHHTFENTIGFLFMIHTGVSIAYNEGIRHITKNMKEFGVSILVAVPAIYEFMYSKIMEGIEKAGKKSLVKNMIKLSNGLRKVGIDLRRVLFKSILKELSPKLRLMASGAAPIDAKIAKTFDSMGITFLQGYGLTEASPLVTGTGPLSRVHGTVGHPILDVEICLDSPDTDGIGEILARGRNIMLGYYESPEETEEVLSPDGWFRTGDLGTIDDKGILRITGRAKSMIVFSNGKKAFPEEYEILLNASDKIKDSFIWGDPAVNGDIRVCAKIVLQEGLEPEAVKEEIDGIVKEINEGLPRYKIIQFYVITKEDLVKTTTLKIKRPIEEKKMRDYIDASGKDMRQLNKSVI